MYVNLVPLAGEGKRYKDAGYTTPKPLIMIGDVPMIVAATNVLPKADRYVFVCRKNHIDTFHIDAVLQKHFPSSTIIQVTKLTEGQASTCLLAETYISSDAILTIGACDNGMEWDHKKWKRVINDPKVDALIWTYRHYPPVQLKPEMCGWVVVDKQDYVTRVSVKIPISDTPLQDHTVVGAFTFKKASDFFKYTKKMIASNRRINNEFYIDELMNVLVESGLRVKVFEIDTYIGWGTPNEFHIFEYWRNYFAEKNTVS